MHLVNARGLIKLKTKPAENIAQTDKICAHIRRIITIDSLAPQWFAMVTNTERTNIWPRYIK
jgi:hypothetical protein